jgi:hypothetical protein
MNPRILALAVSVTGLVACATKDDNGGRSQPVTEGGAGGVGTASGGSGGRSTAGAPAGGSTDGGGATGGGSGVGGAATAESGASSCLPVVARRYDGVHDCYGSQAVVPGVCLTDFQQGQHRAIACLVAPDGTRYAFVMYVTECIDPDATGQGWIARSGNLNICAHWVYEHGPDGGPLDPECLKTVSRGYWRQEFLGETLDFETRADAGSRGDRVTECP